MVSVIVLNNSDEVQKGEIKSFIDEKINIVKTVEDYNSGTFGEVFTEKIKGFVIIAFLSTTLIGVPLAYFCVAKRGFSIGYTIASIYATQSTKTAIIFICNSMLFHNIIYMASIFLVFVAGNNFIKAIIDQDRKNIRFEIVRYLVFFSLGVILVLIASAFEVHISTLFLDLFKKYLWKVFTISNTFDIT